MDMVIIDLKLHGLFQSTKLFWTFGGVNLGKFSKTSFHNVLFCMFNNGQR